MPVVTVDTLRLGVPIHGIRDAIRHLNHDERGYCHIAGGGRLLAEGGGVAYVEASLPKRRWGTNINGLPIRDLMTEANDLLAEVSTYVQIDDSVTASAVKVMRVDVVRDFNIVGGVSTLLDGLAVVPRARTLVTHRVGNHQGTTQSLTIRARRGGSRSWQAQLYDKGAESGVNLGRLRFEALLRKPRLHQQWSITNGGIIGVLTDLTEEKLEKMGKATFDGVGFGSAVMGRGEVVRRASEAGLQPHDLAVLLGVLVLDAEGIEPGMDAKTQRKYRKLAKDMGLRLHPDALPTSVRLDWAAGTDVADVA